MAKYDPSKRKPCWTFVCYPESLPEGWEGMMRDLHVPIAYVLHDADVDADGQPVKPHVHVVARYESVKALSQVREDFAFTGVEFFEPVRSFRTMCRYLCHLDDPSKHPYPVDSVVRLSGITCDFSRALSKSEELSMLADMTAFVEDNDVNEFAALWNYAARNNSDWLLILSSKSAYGISQYIRSRRCAARTRQVREAEQLAAAGLV
ncbi:MAG: hypothetical protein HFJ75_09195 [Eggerthellaceae bacterium]|nr:hypothetical protein [Eggerthellaceae bacterium]